MRLRGSMCVGEERPATAGAARDRHRPHRHRPGRDDPLPPRRLARQARAAGDVAARGSPRAPAAGAHARADRRLLPRARACRGGRTRATTASSTRVRACATVCCRRSTRCTPRRGRTCCAPPGCCARRPRCSTPLSTPSWAGESSIAIERLRELPAALARLVVVRLAEQVAGTYVPQAGARVQEILDLARARRARRAARRRAGGRCDRGWPPAHGEAAAALLSSPRLPRVASSPERVGPSARLPATRSRPRC